MRIVTTIGDGIEALRAGTRPTPAASGNLIVVKMTAASLNFRDLLVIEGQGGWRPDVPRIPLSDGVGVVCETGAGVTRWQVGDRVLGTFLPHWKGGELTRETYRDALGGPAADGVLAEAVAFDVDAVVAAPPSLSDLEAATLPVAAVTAWHALYRRARVKPGDSVLIQGTGGVSLFALMFAAALGARPLVLSGSDEKLERAVRLGATDTVNYRSVPAWEEKVLQLTDGNGVDHVVEVVGGANLNRSLRAVRIGGSVCFIGLLAGVSAAIDTWQFVLRNVRLHGIETGSREMFEEMNAFIEDRGLKPVVNRCFPVAEVGAALHHLKSGGHFGKIVLQF